MISGVMVLNVVLLRVTRPSSSVAVDSSVYWRP